MVQVLLIAFNTRAKQTDGGDVLGKKNGLTKRLDSLLPSFSTTLPRRHQSLATRGKHTHKCLESHTSSCAFIQEIVSYLLLFSFLLILRGTDTDLFVDHFFLSKKDEDKQRSISKVSLACLPMGRQPRLGCANGIQVCRVAESLCHKLPSLAEWKVGSNLLFSFVPWPMAQQMVVNQLPEPSSNRLLWLTC